MRSVVLILIAATAFAGELPKVFGGGTVKEVLWVRLDKGDLVLESIEKAIRDHKITDGAVLTAAGAVGPCKFHGVGGTMTELKEPVELNQINGLIADSKPHFHMVVSSKALGALGGHLEPGCEVSNQAEITLVRFGGPAMSRKKSEATGATALQRK